jgi:hypothetical protein
MYLQTNMKIHDNIFVASDVKNAFVGKLFFTYFTTSVAKFLLRMS